MYDVDELCTYHSIKLIVRNQSTAFSAIPSLSMDFLGLCWQGTKRWFPVEQYLARSRRNFECSLCFVNRSDLSIGGIASVSSSKFGQTATSRLTAGEQYQDLREQC